MKLSKFRVKPGGKAGLARRDPGTVGHMTKGRAKKRLAAQVEELRGLQDVFYAHNRYALLVILQAMDTAGKDSAIKHVMSGLNPQGVQVTSFKAPSEEELDHDYLWRASKALPERGRIGIFNRSYYEEVLVARVRPEILAAQKLPEKDARGKLWKRRFGEINGFEKYLSANGTIVVKFFLHLSKGEQRRRLLERIERPEKNWKFSLKDIEARKQWPDYMAAYEDALSHTSTEWAPWYVVPADHKWFSRVVIVESLVKLLKDLRLCYPRVNRKQKEDLRDARAIISAEGNGPDER